MPSQAQRPLQIFRTLILPGVTAVLITSAWCPRFAEELQVNQQAAQQVRNHESDAGDTQVVEKRDRAKKLGASIERYKSRLRR